MTEFVNGTPSATVAPGQYARLTFGPRYFFTPNALFAEHFKDVYDALPSRAGMFTASFNSIAPGADATTVDARNSKSRTLGQLAADVDALSDNFTGLKSIELLTPAQLKRAPISSDAGARARDGASQREADKAAASNPLVKMWDELEHGLKVALISAVVVLALAALIYAGAIRKALPK